MRPGHGLTSFNKDKNVNIFLVKKKYMKFSGVLLESTRTNFKSNLALVVVLVLESKGL